MSLTILTAYDERPDGTGDLVYRAGGTDLQERLRTTGATPHVLDLTGVPGFAAVERTDAGTRLGAGVTVATVATVTPAPRVVPLSVRSTFAKPGIPVRSSTCGVAPVVRSRSWRSVPPAR